MHDAFVVQAHSDTSEVVAVQFGVPRRHPPMLQLRSVQEFGLPDKIAGGLPGLLLPELLWILEARS